MAWPITPVPRRGLFAASRPVNLKSYWVTPQNLNSSQNVNISNTNTGTNVNSNATVNASTNANTNASVSTAGWKTYTNAELGISFKYPNDWGEVVVVKIDQTHDVNINRAEVESGQAAEISFSHADGVTKGLSLLYSSHDFKQFLGDNYTGGKDLSKECKNAKTINGESYCDNIVV